jgi:hypothetical protein
MAAKVQEMEMKKASKARNRERGERPVLALRSHRVGAQGLQEGRVCGTGFL